MLDVTAGSAQSLGNLTIFPLLATDIDDLPFALMADALSAGTLRVGERGQGTVPTLLAHNSGDLDVLVLDGEQLVGSRQNRMTNRSIILPKHDSTDIPVYCMEQGRWHFESDTMAPTQHHSPTKVRRRARETEHRHALANLAATTDALQQAQGAVWDDIDETASTVGGRSKTGALDRVYGANTERIEKWMPAFPRVDDQIGILAFVGSAPLALDLIACHRLFGRVHDRLLRGYVLDAIERTSGTAGAEVGAGDAQQFLDTVRNAKRVAAPTVGRGRYSVLMGSVIGGELIDGERVVHLSAFPVAPDNRGGTGPTSAQNTVAPPSRRRHHRGGGPTT